ncbi:hypothetical protein GGR58DRAFT_460938 [Xylaria digitata]|nr:hypothetical protein GGR58DRAFT_460938 [Xylaria digitata]
MSNPSVPSAGVYSDVIGNAQQTLNFTSALFQFVGQSIHSAITAKQVRKALRDGLGEWAEEAFDARNNCQQPVLREEAFLRHLIDNRAAFRPSGSCIATFAWAKLLYSLDIRPGSNIIEWQPSGTDANPSESGIIELELEGAVLCHIVNLYQIYKCPYGASLQGLCDRGVTWQFSFGALTIYPRHNSKAGNSAAEIISEPKSWTATFRPYADRKLSATREPFVTNPYRSPGLFGESWPLAFEPNTVAINYVSTVKDSGYSDGVLGLPDPSDTLKKRCLSLVERFAAFCSTEERHTSKSIQRSYSNAARNKPYLVTPSWIEQANRIKRRLTTNGDGDDGLAEHIVEFLSQNPDAFKRITTYTGRRHRAYGDKLWRDAVRKEVRDLCFYTEDIFKFVWTTEDPSPKPYSVKDVVDDELPNALKSLSLDIREHG